MERLLSSSSPTPFKFHSNPSPFLHRLTRTDFTKLNLLPSSRPEFRRLSSLFCKSDGSSQASFPSSSSFSSFSTPSNSLHALCFSSSSSSDASSNGSVPESRNLKKISNGAFGKSKAITVGAYIMLSALIMILIQPIFAPAAFATFQTAAKTGAPAAAAAVGGTLIRTELLSSAWTGFFAGCLHTLSGPDHLAALAPLSIGRSWMESAAVGALWGCGHDAGQVIFGLIFLLLKDRLHIEVIRTWGTRVVGLTLLVIGAMGIREASEVPTPCVALENGECDVGVYEALENPTLGKKKIGFATFATGIVHGLQPDALMMVLPALALPSRLAGAAFLIMFLVGTVVAMGSYTVFIGSCSQALKDRIPRITEKLTWASSIVAIALGLAIIISQFFGYSLY
ncbi:hypothetical protein F8388_005163 [Cannabis sativa]|uniref:Urease accessory protein UreH-like transmembrane domain-containing protein n=3 Tax=Cannabis sativa TaxID=3483 RepID=A0A7J6GMI1_CANSA|nr:hypothetical protein F8388_005163 [Cannabis sativa]KAF4384087.1 hypothetical protein G4B88_030983 [Cannabis sativa]